MTDKLLRENQLRYACHQIWLSHITYSHFGISLAERAGVSPSRSFCNSPEIPALLCHSPQHELNCELDILILTMVFIFQIQSFKSKVCKEQLNKLFTANASLFAVGNPIGQPKLGHLPTGSLLVPARCSLPFSWAQHLPLPTTEPLVFNHF